MKKGLENFLIIKIKKGLWEALKKAYERSLERRLMKKHWKKGFWEALKKAYEEALKEGLWRSIEWKKAYEEALKEALKKGLKRRLMKKPWALKKGLWRSL